MDKPTLKPNKHKTLALTTVGSHVWGMQRPDSDMDYFRLYQVVSDELLLGRTHNRGHENQDKVNNVDMSSFEIGHCINQLKDGNLNHIVGVMSPLMVTSSKAHTDLQKIFMANLSKNCYNSINGMAVHNYKRYFEDNPRQTLSKEGYTKKLGQVGRVITFGIRLLRYHEIVFSKHQPESRYEINELLEQLKDAYDTSTLPDRPDDEAYDDYLIKLRLAHFSPESHRYLSERHR